MSTRRVGTGKGSPKEGLWSGSMRRHQTLKSAMMVVVAEKGVVTILCLHPDDIKFMLVMYSLRLQGAGTGLLGIYRFSPLPLSNSMQKRWTTYRVADNGGLCNTCLPMLDDVILVSWRVVRSRCHILGVVLTLYVLCLKLNFWVCQLYIRLHKSTLRFTNLVVHLERVSLGRHHGADPANEGSDIALYFFHHLQVVPLPSIVS